MKIIAVISQKGGAGKTTLAVNLAVAAELVVIDAAPHSESTALAAARAADLVLIPCRPAILDLKAIGISADLAALAKKPAAVVLNAVPHHGRLAEEAAEIRELYKWTCTRVHASTHEPVRKTA